MKDKRKSMTVLSVVLSMLPAIPAAMILAFAPRVEEVHGAIIFSVMMPFFIALIDILCLFFTHKDKGNDDQSGKIMTVTYMICPLISLISTFVTCSAMLGYDMKLDIMIAFMIGLMFLFIGNELPKCRRNSTIGIKVKWTLENDDNWMMTHRFAGKVWVIGGFLLCIITMLPSMTVVISLFVALIVIMALLPVWYSWSYMKEQKGEGTWKDQEATFRTSRNGMIFSLVILAAVGMLVCILLFTGNVKCIFTDDALYIEASYYADLTLDYEHIEGAELIEGYPGGTRVFGYGSPRMSLGKFRSDELGSYTRYTEKGSDCYILINYAGEPVVVAENTAEKTEKVFAELLKRI